MIRSLPKVPGKLGQQLDEASASVPLNIAEGRRRAGKDRTYHWRVAAGSADETRACLDVAEAKGIVKAKDIEDPLELLDRILAMLYRLTH